MKTLDKLLPEHLPAFFAKDRLRILTSCNYGQVRSVAMMHAFHRRGFINTYATGAVSQWPVVLDRHFQNADLIIVCNKPNLEERFAREQHPDKEGAVSVFDIHEDKIIVCSTIGVDKWGDPRKQAIIDLCEAFLEHIK